MKQLLQDMRAKRPHLADVPVPTPGPGMLLVRNAASLVSAGTERGLVEFAGRSLLGKVRARPDLLRQVLDKARREGLTNAAQAAFGRLGEAMPLGYSSAGTVVEVGEGVLGFRPGQRVVCAGGGYAVHAEYVCVPQNLVAALPDGVDFDSGAFATLGAIALHGFRLAEVQLGARVAVIGLGLLGQLAASLAAAAGCEVLGIDTDPRRVALAKRRGLDAVPRERAEKAVMARTAGRGYDTVLICADTQSDDPVELAGELARDRATVVAVGAVGLAVPRRSYYAKELNLIVSRSYGPGRYDPGYEEAGLDYPIGYVRWTEGRNLQAFADLLGKGALEVQSLVSHRFDIENAVGAYELIRSEEDFLGVLLTYPGAPKRRPSKKLEISAKPLSKDKIGLGVLGAGNFARQTLLPAIKGLGGLELVGIASPGGRAAADLARRHGFRYATSDPAEVLADKQVDALVVLTRHHLHAGQALAGLKAGKHVFCEKPLALTEAELTRIGRALAQNNAPLLTVGFNRRFAPLATEMAGFLAGRSAPLAAHFRVNAGPLPTGHWLADPAQGGGRLLGEGCHFIDFLIFLVGQAPVAVSAAALGEPGGDAQDNVQVTLRFADGSLGTLSYLSNGDRALPKERLEVFCGGDVAVLDDFQTLELTRGGRTLRSGGRGDKGHRAIWQAFAASLRAGGPPPIPYDQLFGGGRAAFAALRSLQTGSAQLLADY
ncbi:MAG: bi-domain-containing oxidoreductase [Anaerolineales bacterium]|nr:bi-domain-containing oxidoreductase [Anaerolineales bacterium]